jgi:hypothetical protein
VLWAVANNDRHHAMPSDSSETIRHETLSGKLFANARSVDDKLVCDAFSRCQAQRLCPAKKPVEGRL